MNEMNPTVEFGNKSYPYFAILLTIMISLLFTLIPFWPLAFIAAIIGGLLCKKVMWGALSAMIGILISWGIYIIGEVSRNSTNLLFDELGILITGSSGFGGWLIIIVLIVGAIIGLLGGTIGSGIRILVEPKFSSNETVSE